MNARRRAGLRGALFALLLATLGTGASGCWTVGYLAKQGYGQLKLLHDRRRIVDVLADPSTPAETRKKLALAKEARDFGVEVLGLRGGDNFTRFLDTHGQPVAWNVSAAPKDTLKPVVHRFPITGAVPYLGYFVERDANKEAARFRARDLDVYVRPVSGYSTLGKLSDPVYSSMLEGSDARIVEVVLHEMTHGTVWLEGRADVNESLATFVGLQGAALFFSRSGGSERARKVLADAEATRRREREFTAFLKPFLTELETLYKSDLSRADKLARREEVFARAKAEFLRRFPVPKGRKAAFLNEDGGGLNNAVFAAYAVYHQKTDLHERIFAIVGRDLAKFLDVYKTAVERDHPQEWLRDYAKRHGP